jgi:hypothetical protein
MSSQQYRRFAATVCEHSGDKQSCGRILDALSQNMDTSAASYFICDVIRYDFFLDLSGSMKSFYAQLKKRDVRSAVENLLSTSRTMDKEGNIMDSDSEADEHGNLK